jgi:outer membrane protein insertion porin family
MVKHDSAFFKVWRLYKPQVINIICLVIIAVLGINRQAAHAQQPPSVVIMPFEIFSEDDLTYLQTEIPSALKTSLEQAGARILLIDPLSDPDWKKRVGSTEEIQRLSVQTGADHVIWGSLTWIGQQFSLDLKLLDTSARRPLSFAAEGEGVENLPAAVDTLAQDLIQKIFKRQKILEINVDGNRRIEAEAIKRVVKTQRGDVYNLKNLSDDLKTVYAMGYFDNIQIEAETQPDGTIVTFKVKEKPTLRKVSFSGSRWAFKDEEIEEVITAKRGSILNINVIQNDMDRIAELYKDEMYHNVKIDYKIFERKDNQADLEYIIEGGEKFQIEKIRFEGNSAFSDKKLKREMTTAESNIFLSWFTSAGDLNENNLEQDAARLTAFYKNNGYMTARVGEPEVKFIGNEIEITIKIDEGPRFKVGKVAVTGDLILPEEEMSASLKISQEEFYNREILRSDVLTITDLYANQGFAYVDVAPKVDQDPEKLVVDITFDIKKGQEVYFEEIIISGNTKTRDKVIRRQLRVYEQERFSSMRLKRSVRNLFRLDFFEDVKVDTSKGSADDKMILKIDVAEKSTGAFSFGAGYGNVDKLFGTLSIAERNLFGRGQHLELKGTVGSKTQNINLSFTEPYIYDMPLSGTLTFYNWQYSYDQYDKDSFGAGLSFSYPIFNYTRAQLGYVYDMAKITNIDEDAPGSIKELDGTNIKSSLQSSLRYDSRDNTFVPNGGSKHSFSFEFAGLGGDIGFMKYIASSAVYIPLFWKFVLAPHVEAGYVNKTKDKKLPDYEKFYLGGIGSLRGFERDDLAPLDDEGNAIGGDKYVQFNLDLTFPLVKEQGVFGGIFFDAGRVYADDENPELNPADLRKSAGLGIRWLSPMGPVRLEYGWILDKEPTDHGPGNWEFSMASAF